MKLIAVLLFVACASAQIQQQRLASIEALNKLRAAIPDFQFAQDSAILKISEAKQEASNALNNFYHNVFTTKMSSLDDILKEEAKTLTYGESTDSWCWENNVPILEGIMGWVGLDFSECVKRLDNSIDEVVGSIYDQFQVDETNISKYSMLEVFQKKNIIKNPQSIINAIDDLKFNVNDAIPELDGFVSGFEKALNDKIPTYSQCLSDSLKYRKQEIDDLMAKTERCIVNEQS